MARCAAVPGFADAALGAAGRQTPRVPCSLLGASIRATAMAALQRAHASLRHVPPPMRRVHGKMSRAAPHGPSFHLGTSGAQRKP